MKKYERPEVVELRLRSEDILSESGDNELDLGNLIDDLKGTSGGANSIFLS